jgi:hypothetical protein
MCGNLISWPSEKKDKTNPKPSGSWWCDFGFERNCAGLQDEAKPRNHKACGKGSNAPFGGTEMSSTSDCAFNTWASRCSEVTSAAVTKNR